MSRLPVINAKVGEVIAMLLEEETGQEVEFILIAFPAKENPQPTMLTSFEPQVAESLIQQLGKALPKAKTSRRIVSRSDDALSS